MANILDKKERVYDLRLTAYGRYLMSVGKYKASYYAFFDDNVIYDYQYCNISESQNSINERIKDDTSYLSSLVLFEDVNETTQKLIRSDANEGAIPGMNLSNRSTPETLEEAVAAQEAGVKNIKGKGDSSVKMTMEEYEAQFRRSINYYASDVTPIQYLPRQDTFKFDSAIGDALLANKQIDVAPAWKIVVLNGEITSSAPSMLLHSSSSASVNIPQVDIVVKYEKETVSLDTAPPESSQEISVSEMVNRTPVFSDNKYIRLKTQDPVIYIDEVNTELLSENFDIEVFLVTGSTLQRKYFESNVPQIVDGFMTRATPLVDKLPTNPPRTSVEYYFDFKVDTMANPDIVCKKMEIYNKSSYYIDIDLDCSKDNIQDVYNDIYGSEVEPEICL